MISRSKLLAVALLALGVLFGGGEADKAEAKGHHHKKVGFFTRVKRAVKHKIKMKAKKVRRAFVRTGCAIKNGIMDSAVKAKSKITGKKPKRVWVKGHYKTHNKHHTKGHWRRVKRGHKPSGGCSNQGGATQAPAPISGGQPLPPLDPALPN